MAAYFIVNLEVTNRKGFEKYRRTVPPIVSKYGGKYVARGGDFQVLEGNWRPKRVIILEFPSMEHAREFYDSEDYKPFLALRASSTNSEVVLVDGI